MNKMQKLLTIFLLSVLSIVSGAECLYASNHEPQAEQSEQVQMVLKGKIGKYPITMVFTSNCWDDNVQGYYYYNSRPKTHFTLKCMKHELVDSNNLSYVEYQVNFEEYTPKGNHTGTFEGVLFNRAGVSTTYSGTFTNSKGKTFDFMVQHLDQ